MCGIVNGKQCNVFEKNIKVKLVFRKVNSQREKRVFCEKKMTKENDRKNIMQPAL